MNLNKALLKSLSLLSFTVIKCLELLSIYFCLSREHHILFWTLHRIHRLCLNIALGALDLNCSEVFLRRGPQFCLYLVMAFLGVGKEGKILSIFICEALKFDLALT